MEVICPYCNKPTEMLSSKDFYGRNFKTNVYVCWVCDAYVGTHKHSTKPLGTPAKAVLRERRKAAHDVVDPLWRRGYMTRNEVYAWIGDVLLLPPEKAHIGMLNDNQCKALINRARCKLEEVQSNDQAKQRRA